MIIEPTGIPVTELSTKITDLTGSMHYVEIEAVNLYQK
jgi:hypothetical protein